MKELEISKKKREKEAAFQEMLRQSYLRPRNRKNLY